jgi:hypothetical protein
VGVSGLLDWGNYEILRTGKRRLVFGIDALRHKDLCTNTSIMTLIVDDR